MSEGTKPIKITVHIEEEHECGQAHEQVYVLEKLPALTLHTGPRLPGHVTAPRGLTLTGRYEAVEINGIEMRENRLLCKKCGQDVLFPDPRFVKS